MSGLDQEFPSGSREDFIRNCKNGEYNDVVALYRSNSSTQVNSLYVPEKKEEKKNKRLTQDSLPALLMLSFCLCCPHR